MLAALGWEAVCARDGAEAVALYRESSNEGMPFSLVILDLEVPEGVGGKDALSELLLLDPDVKAVVSSGYSAEPIFANYRSYGFQSMLAKPYGIEDLARVLKELA